MKEKNPFIMTKKRKEYLNQLGIITYLDILNYLPYRYDSFVENDITLQYHEKIIVISSIIVDKSKLSRFKGSFSRFSLILLKENQEIKVTIFNRPFYYNDCEIGKTIVVRGKYDFYKKEIMVQDLLFSNQAIGEIRPLYSLPKGVKDSEFRKLVEQVYHFYENTSVFDEIIPNDLLEKYRLINRRDAYFKIHFPKNSEDIKQALRYLKYDELLSFSLRMQIQKNKHKEIYRPAKYIDENKMKEVIEKLPYQLTDDQNFVLKEIINDLKSDSPMYRLLQGDVGTGKTLVAALSMIAVCQSKFQSVIMAPTDLLARQHYTYITKLCGEYLKVILLVSNLPKKIKEENLEKINNGEADIVIGTQALIQEGVSFHNLGYAIIDEQHRFGVNQRKILKEKGIGVDFLSMSATPIPRTLAISLYGDMDVSVLTQFPNKSRNVETKVMITKTIKPLIKQILQTIHDNKRIYIICPMIEGDNQIKRNVNDVYEGLNQYLKDKAKVGLLHGKLDDEEKIEIMNQFSKGEIDILVSTTVVEVGVDVKAATMMIIYDAENFGLAQIHQLRGRIGRGGDWATCYLLTTKNDELTLKRLSYMEQCNDGFEIARFDLSLRGPGELIGFKQSGLPSLQFANFTDDLKILDVAQKDAVQIIKNPQNVNYFNIINKAINDLDKKLATFD